MVMDNIVDPETLFKFKYLNQFESAAIATLTCQSTPYLANYKRGNIIEISLFGTKIKLKIYHLTLNQLEVGQAA